MTSSNAFKDGAHASGLSIISSSVNGNSEHASKKRKISAPPQATIFTKKGDASTALEVDHMILDYLAHQATTAVLASRKSRDMSTQGLRHKLFMVDSFLEIFKAKHPCHAPDPKLRFRFLLLKFTTLFCSRLVRSAITPSKQALGQLREANTSRALDWIRDSNGVPSGTYDMSMFDAKLPLSQLEAHRARNLSALKMPAEDDAHEDAYYGTSSSIALLDILPSFMTVIAARNEIANSNISTGLLELAAQFMLQACLEQYLVRGANGSDAIDEAFSWGYKPAQSADGVQDTEPSDETIRMFQDEEGGSQEVPEWSSIKSDTIALLANGDGDSLGNHLSAIAVEHTITEFEDDMMKLISGLEASLPPPVLAQLESGSLDGMTPAETKAFLRSCGLGEGWPNVLG